jgi:hypothetical protein
MFKKKEEKFITIFDLPVIESKEKFQEIAKCIYEIIESPKFAEISKKIPVPQGATKREISDLIHKEAPKKIKHILELLLVDNFESVIKICSLIFCQGYDLYKTKSINQIADDFDKLSSTDASRLLGFFTRAGK